MTVKEYNRSVEEYADAVYRFIRGNLKDEDRSDDIVQDSYEKLWRHVTEIEYPVVKSWLFSTAYHNMIDIIRKEKRMTSMEESYENNLNIAAGPIGGVKVSSHTKMVYQNGPTTKSYGDFSLNMLRYGATTRVGYGNFHS